MLFMALLKGSEAPLSEVGIAWLGRKGATRAKYRVRAKQSMKEGWRLGSRGTMLGRNSRARNLEQALGPKQALQLAARKPSTKWTRELEGVLRRLKPSFKARHNFTRKEGCNPVVGHNNRRWKEHMNQDRRRRRLLALHSLRLGT